MKIYWMKRDLRLEDNPALTKAVEDQCLVLYIFEPSYINQPDFDLRHWQFVLGSLVDLRKQGLNVHILFGEVKSILDTMDDNFTLISHVEIGNDFTFQRDKQLRKSLGHRWQEFSLGHVVRGLKTNRGFHARWIKHMKQQQAPRPLNLNRAIIHKDLERRFAIPLILQSKLQPDSNAGETMAKKRLDQFIKESKQNSNYLTSKLSSYLSWGNISLRQVYQKAEKAKLTQFAVRLKWRSQLMQDFELNPNYEFKNQNQAFNQIRKKRNNRFLKAWKQGMTGYPLIDAAMRCVYETGYLDFKLRSNVVSFLTHILWQPWQSGVHYLARCFTDYEPGVHYGQFQMIAGTSAQHSIRIYDPIKQSRKIDPHGKFIKKWIPELRDVSEKQVHTPWQISTSYPKPIVDHIEAMAEARKKLTTLKNSANSIKSYKKTKRIHARK